MSGAPADEAPGEARPDVDEGRGQAHRARRMRRSSTWLIGLGLVILAGVLAWQLEATMWSTDSRDAGRALVHQFLHDRSLADPVTTAGQGGLSTATLGACTAESKRAPADTGPVTGLLEIPKLGVVAPVEQGVGDAQLDVAVGHDPYSVWPGLKGNAVLEAHDVSYFVNLAQLQVGDTVRYLTPCDTYVFGVSSHAIVAQGAPVYDTPAPTITLVTCWPTDALWFTPDRYLVTADEVSSIPVGAAGRGYVTATPAPSVPVPAALAAQGVTLATYSLPMGTLQLNGAPDPAWAQTTTPLLVQGSGVEAYIAGVRALTEDRLDWWAAVAPGVTPPGALVGADDPSYLTALQVTVTASGAQATAVTLTNTVRVTGGPAPGRYAVTVGETISRGTLVIVSWSLQPS